LPGSFSLSHTDEPRGTAVSVALPLPLFETYTYHLKPGQTAVVGQRVVVPLRGRRLTGYVVGTDPAYRGRTSAVDQILDPTPLFPAPLLDALRWASGYYQHPLGEVLKVAHPPLEESLEKQRFFLNEHEADLLVEPYRSLTTKMKPGKGYLQSTLRRLGLTKLHIRRGVELGILTQETGLERRGTGGRVKAVLSVLEAPSEEQHAWLSRSKRREALYRALLDAILPLPTSSQELSEKSALATLRDFAKQGLIELGQISAPESSLDWHLVDDRPPPQHLSEDQERVLGVLREGLDGFEVFLLHGVTGSGKTEVYIRAIREVLSRGKTALVIVPEISLTPQVSARFRGRFGEGVSILHSGLTPYERAVEWRRVQEGRISIVVGARSAVFAPLRNVGLVVVDEEHDSSYKQEEGFRYNARDFAIVRARIEGCPAVLGSATPSLESRWNAETGRYRHLVMSSRPTPSPLPRVEIVDLRVHMQDELLTARLRIALGETLAAGDQSILFLNRRGFQGRLQCDACGEVLSCPNCSVSLTLHRRQGRALCHYCGHADTEISACHACGVQYTGSRMGTEKIVEKVSELFPQARIERLDRDTVRFGGMETVLSRMRDGEIDILLGTQMVTKGHDFPGVTLVGVLDADHSLWFQDFRAAERTFQLLVQVAGRAGRGERRGTVLVQTRNPSHHAIQAAGRHNYEQFYEQESFLRRELGYPPFGFLAMIRMNGEESSEVEVAMEELALALTHLIQTSHQGQIELLGPVESPIAMLRNRWRRQLLVKATGRQVLAAFCREARDTIFTQRSGSLRISLDLDPQSML